jgi:hypothetical protein
MDSDQSTCKDKLDWYDRHFKPLRARKNIVTHIKVATGISRKFIEVRVVWWLVICQNRTASPDVKDNLSMMSN